MLITPFKDIAESSLDLKYSALNGNKFRLDRIAVEKSGFKEILRKTTHFGICYGNYGQIYDFIDILTDIKSGEVIEINSSITNKELETRVPLNFIYPQYIDDNFINLQSVLQDYKLKPQTQLINNVDFIPFINVYEDELNLDFTQTLGPFAAFISGVTMAAPFRCSFIIDSKLGYNFDRVQSSLKDTDILAISKRAFNNFVKGINQLYKRFKDICEKEKRNIRMHIYISEFGVLIYVEDYELHSGNFVLNLNNSDHCRMLRYLDACVGPFYGSSEEFGNLLHTECKMLIPTLFENDYVQNEFIRSEYPEAYISAYANY